jgi:hypothetical protein
LDENEDEKCTFIIYLKWHFKIDENVIVFATWDLVHQRLDNKWPRCTLLKNFKHKLQILSFGQNVNKKSKFKNDD